MLLRFLIAIPVGWVLVPYLWLRYRNAEERNRRADAWGQKLKNWVMG